MTFAVLLALSLTGAHAQSQSQDVLTLDDALKLAKDRNGTVRSAYMQVKSGDASVVQALAAFYPTVTAQYTYNSDRQQFVTSSSTGVIQLEGAQTLLNTSWTLLDSGERGYGLGSARELEMPGGTTPSRSCGRPSLTSSRSITTP